MEDPLKPLDVNGYGEAVGVLPFREVIRLGDLSSKSGQLPKADDTAIIMYTSGSTGKATVTRHVSKTYFNFNLKNSTGPPKGVIMSHQNIVNSMLGYTNVTTFYENDVYMAYLPLAHVLELISGTALIFAKRKYANFFSFVESIWMLFGIPIGYSTALTMTDKSSKIKRGSQGDASVLRPTIIASVPLILDRIHKNIREKIEASPAITKALFDLSMQYKEEWTERGYDTPIINS